MIKHEILQTIQKCIEDIGQSKSLTNIGQVRHDTNLIETHILDSLGIIQLITFLEKEFNIRILPAEMVIDKFRTIESISDLIAYKL